MLGSLYAFFESLTPLQVLRNVLDIFLVYYIVYRALLVLRGTRAMQVGMGLGVVMLLYVVAQVLQLVTVLTILSAFIQSLLLIIVVVFQNDIRRALQRVGSRAWFGGLARAQESRVIDEVVDAARELARHRIGAIITFEQDANLDEFVGNKGLDIDAKVTAPLLVSLFTPEASNKLHDGSVIIRNLRIAKAGVFFPMPEGRIIDPSFGSRHRAALGITEETDAVVVVVSEERGTISFCFNGNIASDLQAAQLRQTLLGLLGQKVRRKSRQLQRRRSSQSVLPPEVEPRERAQSDEPQAPPPSNARRAISVPPAPLRKATPAPASVQTPLPASANAPVPPAVQTPRAGGVAASASEDDTAVDASLRQSVTSPSRPMPRGQGLELPPDPDDPDDPRSSPT